MSPYALVVDDEADLCRLMQLTLMKMGIQSDIAYNIEMAKDFLSKNNYDFCLTDLKLPDGTGLDLVKLINHNHNCMPVAVITAHGSMDLAIEALKIGAFDFVNKPLELSKLKQLVANALKVAEENREASNPTTLQKSPADTLLDERLVGNSEPVQKLKSTIKKLARSQAPVFLWGESGTGKEVVAKLIHELSPRRDGSFVPVNCGAIPSELMESEFFGHKKGSFTGATTDKIGLFQQANGGTLFLDEVADLPLAMQVKLLRAIQEKTVRAIGDTKEIAVDIRILSATHKDLTKLVLAGAFRQDLFYRINVIELKLPTLNQRIQDIPILTKHFLTLIIEDWQLEEPISISDTALNYLCNCQFSGNVRELRNMLERAITLTDSTTISVEHLQGNQPSTITLETDISADTNANLSIDSTDISNNINTTQTIQLQSVDLAKTTINPTTNPTMESQLPSMINHDAELNNPTPNNSIDSQCNNIIYNDTIWLDNETGLPKQGLEQIMQEYERFYICKALKQTNKNRTQAAELLGMSLRSLRYRMSKLGIEV